MRIETIGNCKLYLGDAREILPSLEPVDLIVTDAPYKVSQGGDGNAAGFGGWLQDYNNKGEIVDCEIDWSDWLGLAFDVLKNDAQAYFMTNGKNLATAQSEAEKAGFDLHTILVWDKRAALPNRYYQNITEFALFMKKGKAKTINNPSSKNLYSIFQRDETPHPTEKPVVLMEDWICNSSRVDDVALDPFMGSGTTGVAAVHTARKFIGIEKELAWFDVACRRIEAALKAPRLFMPTQIFEQQKMEI